MKGILCGSCMDFRALAPDRWVTCRCGNVAGRWRDSARGTMEVSAMDRRTARVIGIHNNVLQAAFGPKLTDQQWRVLHDTICDRAHGYIFHSAVRRCWVAILQVGESNDTFWSEEGVVPDDSGQRPDSPDAPAPMNAAEPEGGAAPKRRGGRPKKTAEKGASQ